MESAIGMRQADARDDRSRDGLRDAGPSVSMLASSAEWGASGLRAEWERALESSDNRLALFQSPEWFDHLSVVEPATRPALACVRDEADRLIGIAPLVRTRLDLEYSVRRVRLWKSSLSMLEISGGVPLLPEDAAVHDRLFEELRRAARGHDGLYLRMVPTSSSFWHYLVGSPLVRSSFALHVPEGVSLNHAIELPGSFQEYLSHFKPKTRSNIQRKVRLLREQGGGELRLRRFEEPGQVQEFLESAALVARRSWQAHCSDDRVEATPFWRDKLTDLAGRGLLRAYLLTTGDRPCAYVVGYQGRDAFHHLQTGYDPSFAKYSPGTGLHLLLYEDLIRSNPPRRVSFGYGDGAYKREFGNVQFEEASVYLINHRLISKLKVQSYAAFKAALRIARGWARRRSSSGMATTEGESKGRVRSSDHDPSA